MLLKYRFISSDLFKTNIENDGLILEPTLLQYINSNIDKIKPNTIIFSNTISIISSDIETIKPYIDIPRISIYYDSNDIKDSKDSKDSKDNYDYKIFKSAYSFEQNNMKISSNIRNCVINVIKKYNTSYMNNKSLQRVLLGIGGEYYVYHVFLKNMGYDKYIGLTNNEFINSDAKYNYSYHKMSDVAETYYLETYLDLMINSEINGLNPDRLINCLTKNNIYIDIIINLSRLNINVLEFIVRLKKNINSFTVISCYEKDFNTKIQLLPNEFTQNMKKFNFIDETTEQKITVYHNKFTNF